MQISNFVIENLREKEKVCKTVFAVSKLRKCMQRRAVLYAIEDQPEWKKTGMTNGERRPVVPDATAAYYTKQTSSTRCNRRLQYYTCTKQNLTDGRTSFQWSWRTAEDHRW